MAIIEILPGPQYRFGSLSIVGLDLESEPVNKVLQVVAYQRVTMQARINDAARACIS